MATTPHRTHLFVLLLSVAPLVVSCTRDLPPEEIFSDRQDAAPNDDMDAPGDAPGDVPGDVAPDVPGDVPVVGDGDGEVSEVDTVAGDAGASDVGVPDSGPTDAGVLDVGQPDGGAADAVQPDSGRTPTCKANETLCDGACFNTKVANAHCGACNQPCVGKCANGVCK